MSDINLDIVFDLARIATNDALKTEGNLARRAKLEKVLDDLKPFENRHIKQLAYHHESLGMIDTDTRNS